LDGRGAGDAGLWDAQIKRERDGGDGRLSAESGGYRRHGRAWERSGAGLLRLDAEGRQIFKSGNAAGFALNGGRRAVAAL